MPPTVADIMLDTVDKQKRSEIMGRVRGKDTKPEMVVRSIAHRLGYRFRLHDRRLQGSPDLVFKLRRKVIFVHGCFWHRHNGCPRSRRPKSRIEFWTKKFEENVARDKLNCDALASLGWKILIIWECETKYPEEIARRVTRFLNE